MLIQLPWSAHLFESLITLQKLRDIAKQLLGEDARLQQLGLTEEEEAFYEILSRHPKALQDFDLIKELVREITALIKQKAAQPDWYKKVDTKAQIMLSVKMVLRRKGVSNELQEILDEIMEQAEARYKDWDGVQGWRSIACHKTRNHYRNILDWCLSFKGGFGYHYLFIHTVRHFL